MILHSYRRLFVPFFLLLSFGLFGSTRASAQIFPGRITGTVTDSQGAAVPGAAVKLTNPSTGLERVVVSGENGDFNFAELALGTYQLTVSKENFKTAVLTGITTALGQVNTIDPVLAVGSASSVWFKTLVLPDLDAALNLARWLSLQKQPGPTLCCACAAAPLLQITAPTPKSRAAIHNRANHQFINR